MSFRFLWLGCYKYERYKVVTLKIKKLQKQTIWSELPKLCYIPVCHRKSAVFLLTGLLQSAHFYALDHVRLTRASITHVPSTHAFFYWLTTNSSCFLCWTWPCYPKHFIQAHYPISHCSCSVWFGSEKRRNEGYECIQCPVSQLITVNYVNVIRCLFVLCSE